MSMTRFNDPADMAKDERLQELASILAAGFHKLRHRNNKSYQLYPGEPDAPEDPHFSSHVAPPRESALILSTLQGHFYPPDRGGSGLLRFK